MMIETEAYVRTNVNDLGFRGGVVQIQLLITRNTVRITRIHTALYLRTDTSLTTRSIVILGLRAYSATQSHGL